MTGGRTYGMGCRIGDGKHMDMANNVAPSMSEKNRSRSRRKTVSDSNTPASHIHSVSRQPTSSVSISATNRIKKLS